ncbi:hypothetical protein [Actinoallomurus sp. NPDC052274]|uniref:hypothetical protein n=1 Tax=Actinoallomurus sp. NPDC052274 TaxID=3155420 RepID=UPI00342F96F8
MFRQAGLQKILLARAHDKVEDDVGAGPAGVVADRFDDVHLVGGDDRGGVGGEQVVLLRSVSSARWVVGGG